MTLPYLKVKEHCPTRFGQPKGCPYQNMPTIKFRICIRGGANPLEKSGAPFRWEERGRLRVVGTSPFKEHRVLEWMFLF